MPHHILGGRPQRAHWFCSKQVNYFVVFRVGFPTLCCGEEVQEEEDHERSAIICGAWGGGKWVEPEDEEEQEKEEAEAEEQYEEVREGKEEASQRKEWGHTQKSCLHVWPS